MAEEVVTVQEEPKKRRYHQSSKTRMQVAARKESRKAQAAVLTAKRAQYKVAQKARQAKKKAEKVKELQNKLQGIGNNFVLDIEDLKQSHSARHVVEDNDINVIFRPNPGPQERFLAASEREILYGGSAGGGKSMAMLVDPLRYAHNKNMRALLLRRNMPELLELIDKSRELYTQVFPGAQFKEKHHRWEFPSGATLQFNFVEDDRDVYRFQGQAFTWIGIDEITHYPTPFVWNYLRSRLRTTDLTIKLYMRCSANPGGIGGWWVKKMFVDPAEHGDAFWATDIETENVLTYPNIPSIPEHLRGLPLFKRRFIPARLTDNPYLMQSQDYMASLASLPEVHRRRLLEGDWDVAEDTAFPEFNRKIHVCEPFTIPSGWHRFRGCDYGYTDPAAVVWFALSFDGTLYAYRELYQKGLDGDALAEKIIEMEWDDPGTLTGPLDPETWSSRGQMGLSPADAMIKKGVRWMKADKGPGSRVRGKVELHKKLRVNPETGKPGLIIFGSCRMLCRVLPVLPLDPDNREDVDPDYIDDHIYDALRYGVTTKQRYSIFPEERAFMEEAERHQVFDETFGA